MSAFSNFVCFGWCTSGGFPLFDFVASSINAFSTAKLWLIRARRLFSINGLFVRFTVDVVFVLLVSWAATGDGEAVDVDGDIGPKFTDELVLLAVDIESVLVTNHRKQKLSNKKKTNEQTKSKSKWNENISGTTQRSF